jgi:hypothetical protein
MESKIQTGLPRRRRLPICERLFLIATPTGVGRERGRGEGASERAGAPLLWTACLSGYIVAGLERARLCCRPQCLLGCCISESLSAKRQGVARRLSARPWGPEVMRTPFTSLRETKRLRRHAVVCARLHKRCVSPQASALKPRAWSQDDNGCNGMIDRRRNSAARVC